MSDADDVDEQQKILKSLWEPHPGQRAVMDHDARFRVVACGRRWGKSEMCAHLALEYALAEPNSVVWWVAPSYQQANEYGFANVTPLLSPDVVADSPKRSKPRKITLVNGSTLSFRSADREDSLRGGGVDFLVIDEAGSVPERAWSEELRPTLSDTLGDAAMIGTPRGRNWFHRWWQRGQSADHADVASWQAPSYQNPHVPDSEIADARDDMPEHVFEQEYLAEFVDESGGVFEDVREQAEDYELPVEPEDAAGPYAIGVDFARMSDWTVGIVLDAGGRVVAIERLQQTSWSRIQDVVERLAETYSPNTVALDKTRDNTIVADLQDSGIGVEPVKFTASRKRTLIENLITRLETGDLVLPSGANVLINELEVFEHDMTDSGTVRYSAPSGFHDDTVDALALAAEGLEQSGRPVPTGTIDLSDSGSDGESSEEFQDTELGEAVFGALDQHRSGPFG
jgi:hypothetical protein